jgi:hypothetical protein
MTDGGGQMFFIIYTPMACYFSFANRNEVKYSRAAGRRRPGRSWQKIQRAFLKVIEIGIEIGIGFRRFDFDTDFDFDFDRSHQP